jgi:hypothetical protein
MGRLQAFPSLEAEDLDAASAYDTRHFPPDCI